MILGRPLRAAPRMGVMQLPGRVASGSAAAGEDDAPTTFQKYVRAGASGSADGSDWTNAHTDLPATLARDTTYWIATGTYSPGLIAPTPSGTQRTRIKRAVESLHGTSAGWSTAYGSGEVVFSNGLAVYGSAYITIDGTDGSFVIHDLYDILNGESGVAVDAGGAGHLIVENITIDNCNNAINLTYADTYIVRNNTITNIRGDHAIRSILATPAAFDSNLIHGNYIEILYNDASAPGSGGAAYAGPDGIQPGDGVSIFDNHFVVTQTAVYTSQQHPDTIQLAGENIKVYNNIFDNVGDSCIDYDAWYGGYLSNIYIYNNLFRILTQIDPYPEYMRFYSTGAAFNSVSNLKVMNNTFIDTRSSGTPPRVGFGFGGGTGAGSGNEFKNNLVVGTLGFDMSLDTGGGSFSMAFANNVYPNSVALDTSETVAVPSLDAAYIPTAGDTVARNQGVSLSTYFTTDKLGTTRPQGAAWDIGAFERPGG